MALISPFRFPAIWTFSAISLLVTPSFSRTPLKISASSVLKRSSCSSSDALSCVIFGHVSVVDSPALIKPLASGKTWLIEALCPPCVLLFVFTASPMSVLVCFDQSVHSIRLKGPNVREYLSVLVLPINEKTVSVVLLVYFFVLCTLNSVLFWGLTPYTIVLFMPKMCGYNYMSQLTIILCFIIHNTWSIFFVYLSHASRDVTVNKTLK